MDAESSKVTCNLSYDGEDFTIPLLSREIVLRGCIWRPETAQPEFVVVCVHGLGGFLTIQHDFANVILQNGGVFMGCDHLGCGRSPGPRASCTVAEICEETELIIAKARELFPFLPIFLFARSLGALASIRLLVSEKDSLSQTLRGVILESPWISSGRRNYALIDSFLLFLAAKFLPLSLIPYEYCLPRGFCHESLTNITNCPLFSPFLTPRLLKSAYDGMTFVRSRAQLWPKTLPILFLQGVNDGNLDSAEIIAWFQNVINSCGDGLVTVKIYNGLDGDLMHGADSDNVRMDILSFVNQYRLNLLPSNRD
jgi:acylglycerol lipase